MGKVFPILAAGACDTAAPAPKAWWRNETNAISTFFFAVAVLVAILLGLRFPLFD